MKLSSYYDWFFPISVDAPNFTTYTCQYFHSRMINRVTTLQAPPSAIVQIARTFFSVRTIYRVEAKDRVHRIGMYTFMLHTPCASQATLYGA